MTNHLDYELAIRRHVDAYGRRLAHVSPDYMSEIAGWSRPVSYRDKCLPYDSYQTLRTLQEVGCYLHEYCPTIRSAISKMVSYTVSSGHKYTVVKRDLPPKLRRGISVSDSVVKEIKSIIDYTMETAYPGGWQAMEEESIVRLYREGEYFRRLFSTDQGVQVRFIEPMYIQSPGDDPNRERDLGIITAPGDVVDVKGFWYKTADDNGQDVYTELSAADVQHAKQGVDANDPRGIPILWTTYCHSNRIKEVDTAMCELAITQSSYAVVRQHESTITSQSIRQIAEGFSKRKEEENDGRPVPGSEVDAKGFHFEFPSMDVDARSFIEIIQQQQRHIAGILDMPEFVLTTDASSGNRASLVSAEGPFDRRIQREQAQLGSLDVDVLWRAVQLYQGWSDSRLNAVRRAVKIEPRFPRAASRDQHKIAEMLRSLTEAGFKSPQQAIADLDEDYDVVQAQIEKHNAMHPGRKAGVNTKEMQQDEPTQDSQSRPNPENPSATKTERDFASAQKPSQIKR